MWPGFDSRTRCHKWVNFVVGSRPCSEGFSPGSPFFLPPQKINISKFQFDREFEGHGFVSRMTVMCNPRKTKLIYFYYFFLLWSGFDFLSHSYKDFVYCWFSWVLSNTPNIREFKFYFDFTAIDELVIKPTIASLSIYLPERVTDRKKDRQTDRHADWLPNFANQLFGFYSVLLWEW